VVSKRLGVLDVPAQLEEIGETCRARVGVEFERFGLEIVNFYVESVSVPESDPSVAALREALAKKMTTLIDAEAQKGAKVLEAESNKAEIEMLGDDRYRMKRGFDTMEKAVEGKGGPGGTVLDLGIGLGAAGAVGKALGDIASGVAPARPAAPSIRCPSCGFDSPSNAKFCGGCGKALQAETVSCPKCKAANPAAARSCTSCSAPLG
jgi:membrane protease subunit (stomatin/prohibitin family)